ncbi:MAG: 4-hydroxy-3-methylbut-2-enyl diphosphate reductase [Fusobacteriaceae bacterium]|nr:4-hydroxy-3-methylbut-2-enyl diphosphate reductase [Fusobacteriaceae bacterium]MBN2837581.1 4-hydroxy-3-methylbut-2-enyl diphosphate reductase [Fusobacteriaceae bacterium]
MKIVRAEELGFCYGVARAAEMVESLIEENKKIYILGMLIHNPVYLEHIHQKGVITVEEEDFLNEKVIIPEGSTVVLRAHGARKHLMDKLSNMNVQKVDTTCPYVTKSIMVKLREEENKDVIYIGDKNHPEVKAVLSYGKPIPVVQNLEELKNGNFDTNKEYSFVIQKTFDNIKFDEIKSYATKTFKSATFKDDLCGATYERQEAISMLAKEVDVVIVIGGNMSSNTQKLYKISKGLNENSYLIGESKEIDKNWFINKKSVGISAGASTPEYLIDEVEEKIRELVI